jgi:hypothetical protein
MKKRVETLNINFNRDRKALDLEKLSDLTMETFSELVGNALLRSKQGGSMRTNNNTKIESGKTYFVSHETIPDLIKILRENKDYFRDTNIVSVKILSVDDYERRIRKNQHIDEMSSDYIKSNIPTTEDIFADIEKRKQSQQIYRDAEGNLKSPKDVAIKLKGARF